MVRADAGTSEGIVRTKPPMLGGKHRGASLSLKFSWASKIILNYRGMYPGLIFSLTGVGLHGIYRTNFYIKMILKQ